MAPGTLRSRFPKVHVLASPATSGRRGPSIYIALHEGGTQGPWPSSTVIFPVPQVLAWPREAPDSEKNLVRFGSWAKECLPSILPCGLSSRSLQADYAQGSRSPASVLPPLWQVPWWVFLDAHCPGARARVRAGEAWRWHSLGGRGLQTAEEPGFVTTATRTISKEHQHATRPCAKNFTIDRQEGVALGALASPSPCSHTRKCVLWEQRALGLDFLVLWTQPFLVLDWDGREPVSARVSLAGPGSGGESEPGGRKGPFPRAV